MRWAELAHHTFVQHHHEVSVNDRAYSATVEHSGNNSSLESKTDELVNTGVIARVARVEPKRCATVMTVEFLNTVRIAVWIFVSVSRSTFAVGSSLTRPHQETRRVTHRRRNTLKT
jgi:hypothetical protein